MNRWWKTCLRLQLINCVILLAVMRKRKNYFLQQEDVRQRWSSTCFWSPGGWFFFFLFHIWKVCGIHFMLLSRVVKQRLLRITSGLGDWPRSWWRLMSVTLTFLWKTTNLAPDIEPKADRLRLFWCSGSGTTSRILFKKPQYHSEHLTVFLEERLKMLLGSHSCVNYYCPEPLNNVCSPLSLMWSTSVLGP